MKRIAILVTWVLVSAGTYAQSKGNISGKILSSDKNPLASATVELLRAQDSTVVKRTASNAQGIFSFDELLPARYRMLVSAVGYEKTYSRIISVDDAHPAHTLEPIVLTQRVAGLQSVTVSGTRSMVVQKADRMVLNVDAFVSNTGATALEVLEKAPGVMVDKDGNISLKGKQGVVVMIDGRPSYLSGAELANMLRGMQASQLEQVEIMTNPPAKYDAAGNSGIINIKTKKNKQKGFNGNLSAGYGQGRYYKSNESLSLNYRNGKINLYSNYSFGVNRNFQQLDIHRRYRNDDGSTNAIFDQVSFSKRKFVSNNLKLGMDYYLTGKTTLGIALGGFYNTHHDGGDNTSLLKNAAGATDSIVYATSDTKETWKNASVNLYARHQFDSTGREISTDLDFIVYNSANSQYFENQTLTPEWVKKYDELLQGDLPATIRIYSAKADYVHPLGKKAKLEAGWKSSFVTTDNKARYFGWATGWVPDYGKTFYFDYRENINAAYLNVNKQLSEKWEVQAGLRYENTRYEGFQYGNPERSDSAFERTYDSWFPTLYVSYKAGKDHQLTANYGRRIDRPSYQDLNPFLFFLDKYTYGAGNPFLRPQYTNNIEMSHTFKGFLTTTLNYSQTKDFFTETFDQEELANGEKGFATIVRQGNIGKYENTGVAVNAQVPVTKWFTSMIFTNYNYSRYRGTLYNEPIDVAQGVLMVSVNNQFKFSKGWSAELSGWYRTKGVEGQILINDVGQLSAGVSKQVLKGKGTVKLNVRDIFFTQPINGTIDFESTEASFFNSRDTRVANITFTWRFGKPLKNGSSPRNRNTPEEQNRVKTGG